MTGAHEVEPPGGVLGWLGRRQVFRRLGLFQPTFDKGATFFEGRYAEELALFGALVERMGQRVAARGGRFLVVLLPGRSAVERPASFSSAYQDHLRLAIAERLGTRGVRVVDLTPPLRKAHTEGLGRWFHPHEGHLDPAGHAEVARLLNDALAEAPKEASSAPDGR